MDEVQDTFRSSTWGWLRGTAAGLATVLLCIGGVAATIGAAGDWGAWPLLATGLGLFFGYPNIPSTRLRRSESAWSPSLALTSKPCAAYPCAAWRVSSTSAKPCSITSNLCPF